MNKGTVTKIVALLCSVITASAQTVGGLEPITRSSLSLDAKNVASSAAQKDSFKTDYGSYNKSYSRERYLAVQLRTMGREPISVVVETIWTGKRTGTNKRVLLRREAKEITIQPGAAESWEASSGHVTGRDMNLSAIGYRSTAGARIDGWAITVRDATSKALLAVRASEATIERLVRTPGEVETLGKVR